MPDGKENTSCCFSRTKGRKSWPDWKIVVKEEFKGLFWFSLTSWPLTFTSRRLVECLFTDSPRTSFLPKQLVASLFHWNSYRSQLSHEKSHAAFWVYPVGKGAARAHCLPGSGCMRWGARWRCPFCSVRSHRWITSSCCLQPGDGGGGPGPAAVTQEGRVWETLGSRSSEGKPSHGSCCPQVSKFPGTWSDLALERACLHSCFGLWLWRALT